MKSLSESFAFAFKRYAFRGFTLRAILLLAFLAFCGQAAFSTTFVVPADDEMIVGARAIITGRVISTTCRLDEQQNRIFTYITIRVDEVLKGRINSRRIVIKQEGGQVGDRGSVIFGSPEFRADERVLLYLGTWADGSLRVYQMLLGKFSITSDQETGQRIVNRDLSAARNQNVHVLTHTNHARGATTDRMELSAYTAMVRARLAANWEWSEAHERTYYPEVPLLAQPPEYRRETKAGRLLPRFTLLPPANPARWFEPDDGQPVLFFVNPDNAPNAEIAEDITEAMNAWSNVAGCSLRLVNGGATNTCTTHNGGINTIVFNNCAGHFVPEPGCSSIIALGGLDWTVTETRRINGTLFYRATSGFISFNPYSTCNLNDHCKTREVATHELGHALGLGHSQHPDATMFSTAHFDGRCASIRADDASAISYVYPVADGGTRPLEVTTASPLPGAVFQEPYVRVMTATGGSMPYTWDLRPNAGRPPQGLSLTTSGVLAGRPTETETTNFTVRVRDGNGNIAEKALSLTVGTSAAPHFDSQFISQTVPTTVQAGQLFNVSLRWRNTGDQVWEGASGLRLGSQNLPNNTTWGVDRVSLATSNIAAGQNLEASFTLTAPHAAGSYNFQWQLYQEGPGFFGEMSANIRINVSDVGTPSISGAATLGGVKGADFSYQMNATGGTPPYAWSVASGSLPPGLVLASATGMLEGKPSSAGSYTFTVQALDSSSRAGQKAITINVIAPIELITSALPSVVRGSPYNQQLIVTGGKPPYSWSVVAGAIPNGINLAPGTGVISGNPVSAGNFSFTVDVTDSELRSARRGLSVVVVSPPLSFAIALQMQATKGVPFNHQLSATGGTPAYSWSVTGGGLPAGLALDAGTGLISGTPSEGGTFSASITVRDQDAQTATAILQLKVTDTDTVPVIASVSYKKNKGKLTVNGERVDGAAQLRIDGREIDARFRNGAFVVKRIVFSRGEHTISIVNSNGESSQVFILNVN